MATPWKFNIATENRPSQKKSNLPTIIFRELMNNFEDGFSMVEVMFN